MTSYNQRTATTNVFDQIVVANNIAGSFFNENSRKSRFYSLESAHRGKSNRAIAKVIKVTSLAAARLSASRLAKKWGIISDLHQGMREVIGHTGGLFQLGSVDSPKIQQLDEGLKTGLAAYQAGIKLTLHAVTEIGRKEVMKPQIVSMDDLRQTQAANTKPDISSRETAEDYIEQNTDKLSAAGRSNADQAFVQLERAESQTRGQLLQLKYELHQVDFITLNDRKGNSIRVKNQLPVRDMQNVDEPQQDNTASIGFTFFVADKLADSDQGTLKQDGQFAEMAGHLLGDKVNVVPSFVGILKDTRLTHEPIIQKPFVNAQKKMASQVSSYFKTYKGLQGFVKSEPKMKGLLESLNLTTQDAFTEAKAHYPAYEAAAIKKNDAKFNKIIATKQAEIASEADLMSKAAADAGCPFHQQQQAQKANGCPFLS